MTDLHDTEMTGTISTARHQVVRYRAGHESGDLFEEGQEFDGLTLTIEVADVADARAMLDAISRRATPADDLRAAEPDYCYDPDDWENTQTWDARHELAESILDYGRDKEPARVSTLICGPDKWVARVPLDTDGDGEADDWENQWFDSEEAARAALSKGGDA